MERDPPVKHLMTRNKARSGGAVSPSSGTWRDGARAPGLPFSEAAGPWVEFAGGRWGLRGAGRVLKGLAFCGHVTHARVTDCLKGV